jgi:prepilin-type N-terminal cleavage/methylation domain-containing protein
LNRLSHTPFLRRPGGGQGGFTLIEMLIVLVLIIIMSVMLYGPASKSYQEQQLAACGKNLQTVYISMKIYAAEHGGKFPAAAGAATSEAPLSQLVPKYTSNTDIFICPGSSDKKLPEAEPFEGRKISYAYYMGRGMDDGGDAPLMTDEQVNTDAKVKGDQVFSLDGKGPGNNHRKYGGIVLFCDGRAVHVEATADRDLACPEAVKLLNPKP